MENPFTGSESMITKWISPLSDTLPKSLKHKAKTSRSEISDLPGYLHDAELFQKLSKFIQKDLGNRKEWTGFIKFSKKSGYPIKSNLDRKLNKNMKNTFFHKLRFPKGSPGSPGIVCDGSDMERSLKIMLKVRATDTKFYRHTTVRGS